MTLTKQTQMNRIDYIKEIAIMLHVDLEEAKFLKELNFRCARNLYQILKRNISSNI